VSKRSIKNISASVKQRLLNRAHEESRPFNELLHYFVMERFLYRLSKSLYSGNFVLKGSLMLPVWEASLSRPTKDIDFLARTENSIEAVMRIVKDVCEQQVVPDGIIFDSSSIKAERITEEASYEGVRIFFIGKLETAKITMQLDFGFGDVVIPGATEEFYPTILNFPAPVLYGYSRESTIAEKFEAMVKLGEPNSRMKDFYDIWLLSRQFNFDGSLLAEAIIKTFNTRGTNIPETPVSLTTGFAQNSRKISQWSAFLKRNNRLSMPENLPELIRDVAVFLGPIAEKLSVSRSFTGTWKAPGPWTLQNSLPG